MQKLKPCMVLTHNDKALCSQVLDMAMAAGFIPHIPEMKRSEWAYVFGSWGHGIRANNIFHSCTWDALLWNQHPDWPMFDARTQMEQIREHFGSEPEFDESPLPNDMKKEKQEEIRLKFNLSPEQWEMMPTSVREALDKAKVTIKVAKSEHVWHPISEPKQNSDTVVVCNSIGTRSATDCGIGYFDGDGFEHESGINNPTHWADIPSE